MTHVRDKFSVQPEIGRTLFKKWESLCDYVVLLTEQHENPESEKGQDLAKQWWSLVMDFTGGDMSILPKLIEFNETKECWSEEIKEKQQIADEYIGKALNIYFETNSIQNPFGEEYYNGISNKS